MYTTLRFSGSCVLLLFDIIFSWPSYFIFIIRSWLIHICFQADLLLSYGYEDDLKALSAVIPRGCQCLLMSATSRCVLCHFCSNPILKLGDDNWFSALQALILRWSNLSYPFLIPNKYPVPYEVGESIYCHPMPFLYECQVHFWVSFSVLYSYTSAAITCGPIHQLKLQQLVLKFPPTDCILHNWRFCASYQQN